MSSFIDKYMDNYREKRRISKIKNPKKRKRQNRLRRALKDNKISKKEASKLERVGVKNNAIDRYAKKRQKRRVKNISAPMRRMRPAGVDNITKGYQDPLISKGANKVLRNGSSRPKVAPVSETKADTGIPQSTYTPESLATNTTPGFDMKEFTSSMENYLGGLMGAVDEATQAPQIIYSAPTNVGGYAGSIAPSSTLNTEQNRLTFGTNSLSRTNRASANNNSNLSITGLNI